MRRPDGREMPSVKRDDRIGVESRCKRDDTCVDSAERKIRVSVDKFGDDRPVVVHRRFDVEVFEAAEERRFGARSQPSANEIVVSATTRAGMMSCISRR